MNVHIQYLNCITVFIRQIFHISCCILFGHEFMLFHKKNTIPTVQESCHLNNIKNDLYYNNARFNGKNFL